MSRSAFDLYHLGILLTLYCDQCVGAANGLGQKICEDLLRAGCTVYAADRTLELLEAAWGSFDYSALPQRTSRIEFIGMDVSSAKEVDEAVKRIEASGSGLFGVVNAAGVAIAPEYPIDHVQGIVELDVDKWVQPVLDINVLGTMRVNKACFPLVWASKGCFVNISSILGHSALAGVGSYSISKKAIIAYSDTLRRELSRYGVRVACLAPGFVRTRMTLPLFHPQAVLGPRNYNHTVLQQGRGDEGQFQLIAGAWEQLPDPGTVSEATLWHLFHQNIPPHTIIDNPVPKLFYTLLDFIPTQWADIILDHVRHKNVQSYKVYGPKS